uniref:Uncharacterized protein n=1 Tax=Pseudo-nitzschia australis TaxID=44445 RepID=A0A7S4ANG5_9STRA|mmetsp:Transcript_16685/g.36381  ORF Transcript_16685/g.36381 Transcript_16685/m.36381 type:complete len:364 (+) Transcript_16685:224-1315(+)
MNFSTIALISLLSSTTTYNAFSFSPRNSLPFKTSPLSMISPGSKNVVAFTTTIHREEVDLESLSLPQLKQMQGELENLNAACTEECTQTNPECDVELKDERDDAIMKIQNVISELTGKNSNLKYVDMDSVRGMVQQPWTQSLQTIRKQIQAMEILNCECTEDGNQTDAACDVQLKDERDSAIEILTLYMKSVQKMLETEGVRAKVEVAAQEERNRMKQTGTSKICLDARVEEEAAAEHFDMGEIRGCVDQPGSRSLAEMQNMLSQLEAVHNACTEEGCQTNAECDLEVKAERDAFMESLVSQIHDAKLCKAQIKAFAEQGDNLDNVAMEDLMNTVINTIPNIPGAAAKIGQFSGPSDEFLVQI